MDPKLNLTELHIIVVQILPLVSELTISKVISVSNSLYNC